MTNFLHSASVSKDPYTAHQRRCLTKMAVLSVRFEVGVSLLLALARAGKRGPTAHFPLVENARIQPAICKRVGIHRSSGWSRVLLEALTSHVITLRMIITSPRSNRKYVYTTLHLLHSTKWNANLILLCDYAELVALCKVLVWKTHIPVRTQK